MLAANAERFIAGSPDSRFRRDTARDLSKPVFEAVVLVAGVVVEKVRCEPAPHCGESPDHVGFCTRLGG